ncbi:glutamate--tRNA ligase [Qipengyuania flava]|uniref:glutamate--tRNA ligase n=1 Tax=Qipengyuania flava TaxID=192812 RepID=UPI001C5813E0|nr:glutamate--tRNA ligase [Qipengyuania flava]MBW3169626.1 glutamate--tRNA ligase [Qipengyuania flava]MBY5966864.1 glutamate--tRNA ligase [Qipengyuania flava]MBY6013188.1 glutamate--tRNA ligase [Qipengyuania flava]MBY6027630.1 glutamate--tRNA ligase [Qipengyuania flava]
MTIVTRFAPSPTGRLHVGNIRTALHNWMLAKQAGGRFLLRIDDTDAERSREDYVEAIRADLAWLGIAPDGEERQSARLARYDAAFAKLQAEGRVYPCYETQQELELKRKIRLGRGLPPIYDRGALELDDAGRAAKEAEGIAPHWRFKLDHDATITWEDGVRGTQRFDPAQLSDPVIRRADGSWLYMLPSAVDDLEMGITHVLRGEDHVSNTAVQIQMFDALIAAADTQQSIPRFAHEALLVGKEGKLSKRLGSLGCDALRDRGIEPQAIVALLARLGTSLPVEPIADRGALVDTFDLSTFGRAPAKFDDAELERINAALVHQMEFEAVSDRLPAGMDAAGWHAIRPNLAHVAEAGEWWRLVTGPIDSREFSEEDRAYLAEAARQLGWGEDPWRALISALKESTGRKGKALFLPLRQALTGMDHGPDMGELLPLIGEARARERLEAAAQA